FRNGEIPAAHLQGSLADADFPIAMRIMPPDFRVAPADLWSVLDNELHASLTWVATAPLDAFAPVTVPLVRTTEISYTTRGEDWRERFLHVAGVVREEGEAGNVVAGATVRIVGTAFETTTDEQGRFDFAGVRPATYSWRITKDDGEEREIALAVPAGSYEIRV
ncbi:MAG: carboxypeptidase-like regulatory domain-containing protein, partial [Dehalococcoidia bacterium]